MEERPFPHHLPLADLPIEHSLLLVFQPAALLTPSFPPTLKTVAKLFPSSKKTEQSEPHPFLPTPQSGLRRAVYPRCSHFLTSHLPPKLPGSWSCATPEHEIKLQIFVMTDRMLPTNVPARGAFMAKEEPNFTPLTSKPLQDIKHSLIIGNWTF